jgi:hypothetical protein
VPARSRSRWLLSSAIEVALPLIEEKGEPERDADQTRRDNRQPSPREPDPRTFDENEDRQRNGGENYVRTEEGANSIREEVLNEPSRIEAVHGHPGKKERVRSQQAQDTQAQIEVTRFHGDLTRLCVSRPVLRRERAANVEASFNDLDAIS